jgi:hypothetical protein
MSPTSPAESSAGVCFSWWIDHGRSNSSPHSLSSGPRKLYCGEMFVQWEDGDRDSVNREPASRIFGIYIYLTIIPVANLLKYKCIHPICADQLYRSNTEIKIE